MASYPVSQPYGYDPTYPLNGGMHNGIDYLYPMGTPVIVNGVTIGLSGATGYVTGPHLHVGRWVGGTVTDPGVGGGFHFNSAVVTEINQDSTNGKYVRVQGDGASWVYLHMSDNSKVSVGQVLKGEDMFTLTKEQIMAISRMATGSYPGEGFDYSKFTGQPASQALIDELIQSFAPYSEKRIAEYMSLQQVVSQKPGGTFVPVGEQLYKKA